MLKKILCLLCCISVIFSLLSGCGDKAETASLPFDTEKKSQKLQNEGVLAKNSDYELLWNPSNCSVKLRSIATGEVWGTPAEIEGKPLVNELGMPIKQHPSLESAIIIEYLNPNTNLEEQALSYNGAVIDGRVYAEKIENGIRVEYYFDDVEIMVPVEYILRDDSVAVSINPLEIQENAQKVTAISVMPVWCSAPNDDDSSYLFYPSGSGALIKTDTISQMGTTYARQVYGRDLTMSEDHLKTTERNILLNVYGAKYKSSASFAIIENSAESALIEARVGSSAIEYSEIYTKFQVRGYCESLTDFMEGADKLLNIYTDNKIDTVMTIGFYPLSSDKADYSGMAECYKSYLKKTNELKEISSQTPLYLSLVGGIMTDKSFLGVPYSALLPATTVKGSQDILKDVKATVNETVEVRLLGFTNSGLNRGNYAGDFKINSNIGSTAEFKEFSNFAKNIGINLYLDFDLISIKNASSGFSINFDVAYSALNKIAELSDYNVVTRARISDSSYRLLSRELLCDGIEKLIKKSEKLNLSGLSLSTLTNTAYSDYSIKDTVRYNSKANMGADVKAVLEKAKTEYRIAGESANSYAAVLCDGVFSAPTASAKENIFSQDIPFYQLVFKGYVSMSGEEINTAVNPNTEFLKAIEAGIGLNFIVSENYYNEFIDHNGYEFYSSCYDNVKEQIFGFYSKAKDYYKDIAEAEIYEHCILENGLRKTVFSNGVSVYVNYGISETETPLGKIGAEEFVWGREAE